MAVTSVDKVRIVESADTAYDGSSYDVQYLVKVDDKDTALTDILNATGIPAFGDEFSEISGSFCVAKVADLVGVSRMLWQVTVTFDNSQTQDQIDGTDTTVYTWGVETIRQAFTVDKDGEPIINTAFDPFIPAPETNLNLLTLQVEREESSFAGSTVTTYTDHVNSVAVTISGLLIAAKTGLMKKVGATYDPAKDNWKVTYNITIKEPDTSWTVAKPNAVVAAENAWLKRILNTGLRQIPAPADPVEPIVEAPALTPITQPLPLDAAGKLIPQANRGANEIWLGFREYDAVDWTSLAL